MDKDLKKIRDNIQRIPFLDHGGVIEDNEKYLFLLTTDEQLEDAILRINYQDSGHDLKMRMFVDRVTIPFIKDGDQQSLDDYLEELKGQDHKEYNYIKENFDIFRVRVDMVIQECLYVIEEMVG